VGTAEEWNNKGKNRSEAIKLIKENRMRGYLAYNDGQPIGWCNANDKMNYRRLRLDVFSGIWDNQGKKTCSVVCFLIDPRYRRKGVASRLLEQVCIDYKNLGYDCMEAYPQKNSSDEYCQGHPVLYKKNGFDIIREFEGFYLARKELIHSS
jgi:ribosomal protein S18 acetylase RimI-like enzyme